MRHPLSTTLFALFAASPLLLLAIGAVRGHGWGLAAFLWMGFATVALDLLLPYTAPDAVEGQEFPGSEALLIFLGLGALALPPMIVAALSARPFDLSSLFMVLAGGLWLGQVAHPAAHELIHRQPRLSRALGVAVYVAMLIGHHASAHRLVHHVHVGTDRDPNSAPRGMGFWAFAPRAWVGSFRAGLAAERARDNGDIYIVYVGGAGVALALAFGLGGVRGVALWLSLAAYAQLQVLLSDYVQHYGLRRGAAANGKALPVAAAHSWNAPHWASSALTLNATRHSDHHVQPLRPYPALRLPEDAPRLPWPLPVAACVALVPPYWRRRLAPLLRDVAELPRR